MKTAVVIGAGVIGLAIAEHLGNRGYDARLASHAELELRDLRAVGEYFERFEQIDLLVNAAGSYGAIGTVRDVHPWEWIVALDINLTGVYACCHHALKRLPVGGHIINLAGGGRGPMPMRSGYAAAKSALWRFTETLAAEETQLHVNAIAPGPMDSAMQDAVVGIAARWADFMRVMRASGAGAVPVGNTLRALDFILENGPTGQLFFARQFNESERAREEKAA
jgi:NAD(P)-dependent dehydrogenase (short-subunit alcohol dehydrogenase family)